MEESYALKHGYIKEENETVVYEIPKEQTNLIETEQLNELKKNDPLFFTFQTCKVDDKFVRIYYEKLQGYRPIQDCINANSEVKRQIAINLLSVEKMLGTQYTTIIHPSNIYADSKGNVKLAHRGIRSVFPTEELTVPQLLSELKKIVIYLFSSYSFSKINNNMTGILKENSFIKDIHDAVSIKRLRRVLEINSTLEPKNGNMNPKVSLISGILIGLVTGIVFLYVIQVGPVTNAADKQRDQMEALTAKNKEMQTELNDSQSIINAYHAAITGDTQESVSAFESAENLNEDAEKLLLEQYLELNTPESLEKVVKMSKTYPLKVINGLRKLNSKEANQAILNIESDMPEVSSEKAWINEEYKNVIEIYKNNPDNERAKLLAANSYIEQKNHKKAMKLGKELDNKDVQIASLKVQKNKIKNDDDMDDDKKDDKIEKLDKKIDKLK